LTTSERPTPLADPARPAAVSGARARASRTARAVGLALAVCAAWAPGAPLERAAHATEPVDLSKFSSGRALKSNVVPPGKSVRYGRAEILVTAPLELVRREVTAYNRYRELAPDKFNRSRIIAKENGQTDVYMQVPILGGMLVLWQVMRFGPVTPAGPGAERIEGSYVRGNLKTANVVYTLTSIDARRTVLRMDLLVLPNMTAPQSVVDEELRDAAATAIEGMRDRAERQAAPPAAVASSTPAAR
jgi:hypothetical protein